MPMVECEEPYDGRLSSTVPRETGGETPPVYSTQADSRDKLANSLNECYADASRKYTWGYT